MTHYAEPGCSIAGLALQNGNHPQSVICKKMAKSAAFWVDRQIGLKFTVFV